MHKPGEQHNLANVIRRMRQRALNRKLHRMRFTTDRYAFREIVSRQR
jgi:hypothetical protein